MAEDDDEVDHELLMPFVSVVSKGGPHDDDSYVAGYEMGRLSAVLEHQVPQVHDQMIHAANAGQADLLAMHHGYSCEIHPVDEEWSHAQLIWVSDEKDDHVG